MSDHKYILAVDQGTSSAKAIILGDGKILGHGHCPLGSIYPKTGYVEQDPEEIYSSVITAVRNCLMQFRAEGYRPSDIVACGISNQRETFVLWDQHGNPLSNAVVWQCKRSISICEEVVEKGLSEELNRKTGLIIDPYFSGTKVLHLSRHNRKVKQAIESGDCLFGTIDTWLLFRLTNGLSYCTDYTNASRTMFFNINSLSWDHELLAEFGLEKLRLPTALPSNKTFGETTFEEVLPNMIPITAMIGDSHAAAFGEKVFEKGMAKVTMGTGSSILWNTGQRPVFSKNGLVTTICWSEGTRVDYALEGVIVSCGSIIEWLKNQLGLFVHSDETEDLARSVESTEGVHLIPAFSGMGAPYWRMDAKAAITGLTFSSNKAHIVRAALEAIAFQIKDIVAMMENESGLKLTELRANGGLTKNHFLLDLLGPLLGVRIVRSSFPDISALGAAYMAGLGIGAFANLEEIKNSLNERHEIFFNKLDQNETLFHYHSWKNTVQNYLSRI